MDKQMANVSTNYIINQDEALKIALSHQLQKEDSLFRYIFERIKYRSKEEGLFYYYFDLEELPGFKEYLKGYDECCNPIQQLVYFFNVFESLGYKVDFSSIVNKCDLNGLVARIDELGQPESEEDQQRLIDIIIESIATFTLY